MLISVILDIYHICFFFVLLGSHTTSCFRSLDLLSLWPPTTIHISNTMKPLHIQPIVLYKASTLQSDSTFCRVENPQQRKIQCTCQKTIPRFRLILDRSHLGVSEAYKLPFFQYIPLDWLLPGPEDLRRTIRGGCHVRVVIEVLVNSTLWRSITKLRAYLHLVFMVRKLLHAVGPYFGDEPSSFPVYLVPSFHYVSTIRCRRVPVIFWPQTVILGF